MIKRVVNWTKGVKPLVINLNKYNEKLEEVKNTYREFTGASFNVIQTIRMNGCYKIVRKSNFVEIRLIDHLEPYIFRFSFVGVKQENVGAGKAGLEYYNDSLKEKTGDDDISFFKVFSGKKYKDIYTKVKKCVISPFDYCDSMVLNKKIMVNKADVSSAYPNELCKDLPTFHDCKELKGRVEPNEEYPFAFYINSRHVKIFNELYTADFANTKYPYRSIGRKWNPKDSVKPEDDITILCKKEKKYSKYIKEISQELYNGRKDNPEFKMHMNAFIGKLQSNDNPWGSCISAVVIARCANNMVNRCKKLLHAGCRVVLVNTDSISWMGNINTDVYTTEKKLGNFVLEYTNIPMIIKSVKGYQYIADGVCKTIYSGELKEITKNWKFGEIVNKKNPVNLVRIDEEGFLIGE